MSAPSSSHEERVEALETLAALAGFSTAGSIGVDLVPDVVRFDLRRRRMFLGDAKATESPSCRATRKRLSGYASAARAGWEAGVGILVAIAHGRSWESDRWAATIGTVFGSVGLEGTRAADVDLEPDCTVVWIWMPTRFQQPSGRDGMFG